MASTIIARPRQFVISLGGSIIVPPEGIDWRLLKKFRALIKEQIRLQKRFFIIAGGGATSRRYLEAADKIVKVSDEDRDWLGIHTTRLNAHLLRTVFYDVAYPRVIKNPTYRLKIKNRVIIGCGWKPGWSTDYVAVLIAQEYNVKTIINLSNIDYVYDKDPKLYLEAKKLKQVSWDDFRRIVGNKWSPGLNAPFDPIASQKAQQLGLRVVLLNGKKLVRLKNFLTNGRVEGTIIE
ncbi:UMP kinase [Candidatus Parcubacteria bacterium]|nr:MAG: UMP kinase [Candidatus Parcubacteria bacterium]